MTCPPDCTCPESELAKQQKSRYFVGITTPVIFVAFLSFLAFVGVVLGGCLVAGLQVFFFLVLPLASAGAGAFLVAAPQMTLLGSDPTVTLLLRAAGGLSIAYAGGALLVSRSSCAKMRGLHLVIVASVLGAIAAAFAADEGSDLAGEVSPKAACVLGKMSLAAAATAAMTIFGPILKKKIESGKPSKPGMACFE